MNAQIATIKIKYGEKEIELTEEEAKALKVALNGLFVGQKSSIDQYAEFYKKQQERAEKNPINWWDRNPIPRPNYWWGRHPSLVPAPVDPNQIIC